MSQELTTQDGDETRIFAWDSDVQRLSSNGVRWLKEQLGVETADACASIACPAQYAGWTPSNGDVSEPVANRYDTIVGNRMHDGDIRQVDGDAILTEDDARECWLDALRHMKKVGGKGDSVEIGVEIAREIGWLGEDETVEAEAIEDA